MTPSLGRQRFARFVARVLHDARDRGMTDKDIERATGIGASTFHRWRRAEFREAPEMERVRKFCEGLGVPLAEALAALGMTEKRVGPEPPMDPDVLTVLRALADPNVSPEEKRIIREMINMIASRHRPRRRRDDDEGREAV